ncbi:MAG: site-2 protease family protein [Clostridia bacterium]|nr:site-2 protease family protein [Clostridia bacterium]
MLYDAILGELDFLTIVLYIISSLFVIFLILPIHEVAHAFIATKLGDPTARNMGRLTLNPFAHIDWIGAAAIMFFGFGWANPVPVHMANFRKPKRDMAITALAGPLSNILLAFVSMIICYSFLCLGNFGGVEFAYYISDIFYIVAHISTVLAVFNLIPIPPLDGSKILAAFLPDRIYIKLMRYERYCSFVLLIMMVTGLLDTPISFLSGHVLGGIQTVAFLPFKLFIG